MSDVATMEQMVCYVQYFDSDLNEVKTDFLFICNILENADSANSKTLFNGEQKGCSSNKVEKRKLIAYSCPLYMSQTGISLY